MTWRESELVDHLERNEKSKHNKDRAQRNKSSKEAQRQMGGINSNGGDKTSVAAIANLQLVLKIGWVRVAPF